MQGRHTGVWMQNAASINLRGVSSPLKMKLPKCRSPVVLKKTPPRKWRVGKAGARQSNVSQQGQTSIPPRRPLAPQPPGQQCHTDTAVSANLIFSSTFRSESCTRSMAVKTEDLKGPQQVQDLVQRQPSLTFSKTLLPPMSTSSSEHAGAHVDCDQLELLTFNLEVDLLNAKAIWRVPKAEYQGLGFDQSVSQEIDYLGIKVKLHFYPKGCQQYNSGSTPLLHLLPANSQLSWSVRWNNWHIVEGQIGSGHWQQWQSQTHESDVEVTMNFNYVGSEQVAGVILARWLKSELDKEKGCRQESEAKAERLAAEVSRCHALMNAGSDQAGERESHLIHSAVKIQAKWRQVLTRRWFLQERSERVWRRKQAKFQAETPYDAILAFDSLAKFLEERKIELLQKAESHFEVAKESANRYRIIAVVGLFDKGKTWLLNKLFGVNLPAGKLCTTRGLSFLWIKKRRMLLLDSAGVQSTVSYRKQAVDAIHDAMTTESLVISHQMIFVVNDLTWFEQKYLAMLHQNYVQCKKNKELIVVHNLRTTSDVAEATMLFKGQVMQCYDGEPSPGLNFTAYHGEGVPPVHHIGLCYEFSKAGDEFNAKNREHLLHSLEIGNRLGTTMALTDILQSELSELLPKYVNIETNAPEACLASPGQAISVSFELAEKPSAESNGYGSTGNFSMHLSPEQARVTTKTRGIISPLGEIIAHNVSFDPVVNVFDKELENGSGMRRFIRIECPGVDEDEIDFSDDVPNGVKVVINKKAPIEEHAVREVEPIRQTHGVWMQEFSFDQSEGCFKPCEDETTLENGVLTIVLKKTAPRKWRVGKVGARQSNVSEQGLCPSPTASVCTSTSWAAVSEAMPAMPARAA
eukprot:s2994_g16.t3